MINPWHMLAGFALGWMFPGFMFVVFLLAIFASKEGMIAFFGVLAFILLVGRIGDWQDRKRWPQQVARK